MNKLEGVPLDCTFKGSLDNPKRKCDAGKLLAALGLNLLKSILKLPTEILPDADEPQQTTQEKETTQTQKQQAEPVDPAKELLNKALKSIFN